jgi:bifunctional DNA-binding transcriptional regulator/antitoxin component of YhaV-PrlF toxin-antitoxin module
VRKDAPMTVLKIEDPTHIQLPEDVGKRLGLKQGDVVIITIEADRMILEKRLSSPVDASFGLWAHLPPGPEYVNTLRDEWDERLTEQCPDA